MRAFNMALLTKQSGRAMIDESTLLHKMYKTRYLPDTSFMGSKLGD